jgi:hypothetical protein
MENKKKGSYKNRIRCFFTAAKEPGQNRLKEDQEDYDGEENNDREEID